MATNNKYGYKICYQQIGKSKLKLFLVTNTLDSALWSVRWYEKEQPPKIKHKNIIWKIIEVKTLKEYEKLWKGCPFKDSFSN